MYIAPVFLIVVPLIYAIYINKTMKEEKVESVSVHRFRGKENH